MKIQLKMTRSCSLAFTVSAQQKGSNTISLLVYTCIIPKSDVIYSQNLEALVLINTLIYLCNPVCNQLSTFLVSKPLIHQKKTQKSLIVMKYPPLIIKNPQLQS